MTGSSPVMKTIGMVGVADLAARVAGGPPAAMTLTLCLTRSSYIVFDEVLCELGKSLVLALRPSILDAQAIALDISGVFQPLQERRSEMSRLGRRPRLQESDDRHRRLLCACHHRPRNSSTAEQRDELPPPHSITSSARASMLGDSSIPIAFAVFRLTSNSNLVGPSTGSSLGLAPFNILST